MPAPLDQAEQKQKWNCTQRRDDKATDPTSEADAKQVRDKATETGPDQPDNEIANRPCPRLITFLAIKPAAMPTTTAPISPTPSMRSSAKDELNNQNVELSHSVRS